MTISTPTPFPHLPLSWESGPLHCFSILSWVGPSRRRSNYFQSADCSTNLRMTRSVIENISSISGPGHYSEHQIPTARCFHLRISGTSETKTFKTGFLSFLPLQLCFSWVSSISDLAPSTPGGYLGPDTWQPLIPPANFPFKMWPTLIHLNTKTISTTTFTKAFTLRVLFWCLERIDNSLSLHNDSMKWFYYKAACLLMVTQLVRGGTGILTGLSGFRTHTLNHDILSPVISNAFTFFWFPTAPTTPRLGPPPDTYKSLLKGHLDSTSTSSLHISLQEAANMVFFQVYVRSCHFLC